MTPHVHKFIALLLGIAVGALAFKKLRLPRGYGGLPPGEHREVRATPVEPASSGRTSWKRWLLRFAVLLAVLGVGGFIFAAAGLAPIKASSGHWKVTRWILQFAKSRAVSTQTLLVSPPSLDEPRLVLKGAGHFETGCAPCHGSPQRAQSRFVSHMLPIPPGLQNIRSKRDAGELFYIVKHGIKFTGMPAWPAQDRDDEVWAVVAFLLSLPELDGEDYQRLVRGEASTETPAPGTIAATAAESCARCHGHAGNGRGSGAFPKLAGQRQEYLLASLRAYAEGKRDSGIMGPIAAALSPDETRSLAEHYSRMRPAASSNAPSAAFERGRVIAGQGIPGQGTPACAACHIAGPEPRNPHYPTLAGQYAEYLQLQLELFKSRQRGGTDYAHIMHNAAEGLTSEQIRDVAAYFAGIDSAEKEGQ